MTDNILSKNSIELETKKLTDYHMYTSQEQFEFKGEGIFSVQEFWEFTYSYLEGQIAYIAEFLVAKALGITKAQNVKYWTAYDIAYRNKRIEIKSTSYVHSWNTKKVSNTRIFSIRPSSSKYWSRTFAEQEADILERQSDIYIFCLNTNKEIGNEKSLLIDDWDFYVVPTKKINAYCNKYNNPNQKTLSLHQVIKLSDGCIKFDQLKVKIDEVIDFMQE